MSEEKRRRFSREFKLALIARLEAGESGTVLNYLNYGDIA